MKSKNEVLEQIKKQRSELLNQVRNSMTQSQNSILNNIDTTIDLISKDEATTKQLKSITTAKEMIASLMTKAALATTDEEIIEIRKSLNYYLNKVKKEIKGRNIDEELYNKYYTSVSYLREDISEYLRTIRRQVKLDRIAELINSENLTKEELKELKTNLNNEKRFNKRLIEKYNTNEGVKRKLKNTQAHEPVQPSVEVIEAPQTEIIQQPAVEAIEVPQTEVIQQPSKKGFYNIFSDTHEDLGDGFYMDDNYDKFKEYKINTPHVTTSFNWQNNIKRDYARYNLEKPNEYNDNFLKNIFILFSNIGIYYRNNDRAKQMMFDYNMYSRSESLNRLIAYTLYNNSIRGVLTQIFRKTALGRHESEKAIKHRLYMEEIYRAIAYEETAGPTLVKTL